MKERDSAATAGAPFLLSREPFVKRLYVLTPIRRRGAPPVRAQSASPSPVCRADSQTSTMFASRECEAGCERYSRTVQHALSNQARAACSTKDSGKAEVFDGDMPFMNGSPPKRNMPGARVWVSWETRARVSSPGQAGKDIGLAAFSVFGRQALQGS